ncbi:MAG: aldehyde ferredoxin oxidoreductase family protein [Candidatus Eisenbacteria sp.]|nr:aldehyde ferredoxin oxidoreductase family protein [Candidatus Eisenbacteria bacterium]
MYSAYMNRWIEIDLTTRKIRTGTQDMSVLDAYIGAKGVGFKLLTDYALDADPFSRENPIIFVTGPLTGTHVPTAARSALVTKSPLFGGALDSHVGGSIGPKIKAAGYDYITVIGRSSSPVVLHITPKGVEFLEAGNLWGKGIFETERNLKQRFPDASTISIGPAGENLVRFACVANDLYRHYGRGGAGAVMGSKNLKAIMVDGDRKIEYSDRAAFMKLNRKLVKDVVSHPTRERRYELGTMMWVRMGQEVGRFLPTRNFQAGEFDEYEGITSETMKKELNWEHTGCWNCIIRCSKLAKWDGKELEGPEYETTAFLGSGCGIGDAKTVAEANWLCDDLGLDTISCGVTASFAMECFEKGMIGDADGLDLRFGNGEALLELIPRIARREGLGDLLAEGTRGAAERIGQGSDYFAINTSGMELSGVNVKGCLSMGLALATSDFASHTRLWTATDEMSGTLRVKDLPSYVMKGQDEVTVRNCLVVCDFLMYSLNRLTPILNAATGMNVTDDDLMRVGERVANLARMFNRKNGRTKEHDTLPERFFSEPMTAGLLEGMRLRHDFFDDLVQKYYKVRGWHPNGAPTDRKLKELGLHRL